VWLTYRVVEESFEREGEWVDLDMSETATATYAAIVGAEELSASLEPPLYGGPGTLEYYIQASDDRDNSSVSPAGKVTIQYCVY